MEQIWMIVCDKGIHDGYGWYDSYKECAEKCKKIQEVRKEWKCEDWHFSPICISKARVDI